MKPKIFIDGEHGTTGLQIRTRMAGRSDVELLSIPEAERRNAQLREDLLNSADVAILCLPDDAAKEAVKANRARVDEDDAKGVADLRAKGMTVIDNVDKSKFVAALAPVNAQFEKDFGKANLDKIRDYK